MFISTGDRTLHRTAITAADSGDDPTAWADAPSAFPDMSGYNTLRIFPVLNSGTVTACKIRVFSKRASTYHISGETDLSTDFTELVDLPGYAGEPEIYVKISTLTGSSPDISLYCCGVNDIK